MLALLPVPEMIPAPTVDVLKLAPSTLFCSTELLLCSPCQDIRRHLP